MTARSEAYAEYIRAVATTGEVDEVDVFTLPGGMRDGDAPGWWFIDQDIAEVIAAVDRSPAIEPPPIIIDYKEEPMPEEATIGSGLLEMMEADGTTPAQTQSTWLPLGKDPAEVEECYGSNGTRYAWLLNGSGGFRFPPDR